MKNYDDYNDYESLTISVKDGVAWMDLSFHSVKRPELLMVQHTELAMVWQPLARDPEVRTVIIRGSEDEFYASGAPGSMQSFSSEGDTSSDGGADGRNVVIPELMGEAGTVGEITKLIGDMIRFPKPVIAAVNGPACGAGLCVAMLADIAIIAEDTWLADPHLAMGISAGDGPGGLWPLHSGMAKAKLYLMTGDAITGTEAERIGLVARAVPSDQVEALAADYAQRLAGEPPIALRYTKRSINQWYRLAEVATLDYSTALETLTFFTGEHRTINVNDWPPRLVP